MKAFKLMQSIKTFRLMQSIKTFRLIIRYLKFNLSSQMEYRGNFILQTIGMVINDVFLLFFWWILFQKVGTIKDYGMNEMLLVYSITTFSFGISMTLWGNQSLISRMIMNGEIDSFLILPRPVLSHILVSRLSLSALGDLVFGFVLFFFSGYLSLLNFLLFILLGVMGAVLLSAYNVLFHSFTFWYGDFTAVAEVIPDSIITFSLNPEGIYTSVSKLIIQTVIPAMYFSFLPVRLIKEFSMVSFLFLLIADMSFVLAAYAVFYKGLKRYESGNLISKKI